MFIVEGHKIKKAMKFFRVHPESSLHGPFNSIKYQGVFDVKKIMDLDEDWNINPRYCLFSFTLVPYL
ncbi:MAG: hypothetical protein A2Y79_11855 [Deltaproteobacteria bacterium RBG_13_43_22]|nr:MAG: hypothetical protein A2Y79_11855 [Deltaproteobacteria bacterium RBG_13_43_22]